MYTAVEGYPVNEKGMIIVIFVVSWWNLHPKMLTIKPGFTKNDCYDLIENPRTFLIVCVWFI
jgi:hypothetical protein